MKMHFNNRTDGFFPMQAAYFANRDDAERAAGRNERMATGESDTARREMG